MSICLKISFCMLQFRQGAGDALLPGWGPGALVRHPSRVLQVTPTSLNFFSFWALFDEFSSCKQRWRDRVWFLLSCNFHRDNELDSATGETGVGVIEGGTFWGKDMEGVGRQLKALRGVLTLILFVQTKNQWRPKCSWILAFKGLNYAKCVRARGWTSFLFDSKASLS